MREARRQTHLLDVAAKMPDGVATLSAKAWNFRIVSKLICADKALPRRILARAKQLKRRKGQ